MNTKHYIRILGVLLGLSLALNGYFFWRTHHYISKATEYGLADVRGMIWHMQNAGSSLQSAQAENWKNKTVLWQAAQSLHIANIHLRSAAHTVNLADSQYQHYIRQLPITDLDVYTRSHERFIREQARNLATGADVDTDGLEKVATNLPPAGIPISRLESPTDWQALTSALERIIASS